MSEHQHWITKDGEYQTQVFYTSDADDPDADHPTEWVIFRLCDGGQVAKGWGSTPRQAREKVKEALSLLRSNDLKDGAVIASHNISTGQPDKAA